MIFLVVTCPNNDVIRLVVLGAHETTKFVKLYVFAIGTQYLL